MIKLRRASLRVEASSAIIVGMKEPDIARFGYPASDELLSCLIEKINKGSARAIGIDIYRDHPVVQDSSRLSAADVRQLTAASKLDDVLRSHSNVLMIMKSGDVNSGVAAPLALHDRHDQIAMSDMVEDSDSVLRRSLCYIELPDNPDIELLFSLSFLLEQKFLACERGPDGQPIVPAFDPDDKEAHLHLGKTTITPLESNDGPYVHLDARGYQLFMDYGIPSQWATGDQPLPIIAFGDVIDGKIKPDVFNGKIVLIGMAAPSVKDYFTTPIGKNVFGCVLHGIVADQLVRAALRGNATIGYWPYHLEILWILAWTIAGAFIGWFGRSITQFIMLALPAEILLIISVLVMFCEMNLWVPVVTPGLTMFCSCGAVVLYFRKLENTERQAFKQLFEKHVSADFAKVLWDRRSEILAGGKLKPEKLRATVLFTDLKGFSTASEGLAPEDVMNWINEYMEEMSRVVKENQGVVVSYIGDAIMAVFGVPVSSVGPDGQNLNAINAVQCALQMRSTLAQLNRKWDAMRTPSGKSSRPATRMRVGINTGDLVSGSIGGKDRMEFTVLGDTVNTAARLESHKKKEIWDDEIAADGCRIIISDSTLTMTQGLFSTRKLEDALLDGKTEKVPIYGVLGKNATTAK